MSSSYPHVCITCARHASLKEVETETCMDCGGAIEHDKRYADSYLRRQERLWPPEVRVFEESHSPSRKGSDEINLQISTGRSR